MLVDREQALPDDASDQMARKLLIEVRSQYTQKLLGRPICDLDNDLSTNLLAWLLDAYDDALAEDDIDD